MAAPLSGVGQQQQIPVSQALQPVSNDENRDVRTQESDPQENEIQVREAPAAQSQETKTNDDVTARSEEEQGFSSVNSNSGDSESGERGSVVDIEI